MDMICHGLEADGILTGAGNKKWYTSTVKKILTNEKYIGDALLQKTCTIDILNKTRVANNGIAPQYYVEDDHEAIIPKEIYMKVQEELVRRRNVQASPSGKKRMYSCTHCFSQMVVCGSCGEVFLTYSLEQPWLPLHCLAVRQQAGIERYSLQCSDSQ